MSGGRPIADPSAARDAAPSGEAPASSPSPPPLRGDLPPPRPLSGWGRFPTLPAHMTTPTSAQAAARAIRAQGEGLAPRGAGRAYGDAALPPARGPGLALSTDRLDRLVAFDESAGALTAEAGVTLGEIATAMLPRGLFPAVVPGTRFVSLGGAIAADVHGKNHHAPGGGSFCDHLDWIELMDGAGEIRRLGPLDPGFAETCGGMGLTGLILRARLRLRPVETGWLRQEAVVAPHLDQAMEILESSHDWTHSSAWIDCLARGKDLGRAIVYRAEDATLSDLGARERADRWALKAQGKRLGPPPDLFPGFALNGLTMRLFNTLYAAMGRRAAAKGASLIDWGRCFHPLDAILGWNRVYGRRGFVQFQCVLPPETARQGLAAMLGATSAAGQGSFLAVLKKLGPGRAHRAGIAFPREGWTLAMDFPATRQALFVADRLHALCAEHGGRIYLAKDALMSAETLRAMDPRAETFARGPARDPAFATALARRLKL